VLERRSRRPEGGWRRGRWLTIIVCAWTLVAGPARAVREQLRVREAVHAREHRRHGEPPDDARASRSHCPHHGRTAPRSTLGSSIHPRSRTPLGREARLWGSR
jgi:hypothetical protein